MKRGSISVVRKRIAYFADVHYKPDGRGGIVVTHTEYRNEEPGSMYALDRVVGKHFSSLDALREKLC